DTEVVCHLLEDELRQEEEDLFASAGGRPEGNWAASGRSPEGNGTATGRPSDGNGTPAGTSSGPPTASGVASGPLAGNDPRPLRASGPQALAADACERLVQALM